MLLSSQIVCCLRNGLQAFRVLLQQRVSAVAVLSGVGSSVNMRLVGNLSASDLRHLKPGGFGRLALSVKQFLASKPVAPDQVSAADLFVEPLHCCSAVCLAVLFNCAFVPNHSL